MTVECIEGIEGAELSKNSNLFFDVVDPLTVLRPQMKNGLKHVKFIRKREIKC